MEQRVLFIAACRDADEDGTPLAELCRRFGISRKTGYKWLERYATGGVDGLRDGAPIPREPAHRTDAELVSAIISLRKRRPTWGPRKLRSVLHEEEPNKAWPAPSTIGDLLKKAGLIRPRKRRVRAPPGPSPLLPGNSPNDLWCIDFKGHFALGDRNRCHPLTLTDAASRYVIKCEGLVRPHEKLVRPHLELAFREFGLPARIRSDNGAPFASTGAGGLTRLSVWWIKLGIVPERIEPGHPEQNGRHERMHRTLKAETASPPAEDMLTQQQRFDYFRGVFNDQRPHEALGMRPPRKVYFPSARPYPIALEHPEYADCKVRWTDSSGGISWRGERVLISSALENEPVGLQQIGDSTWAVYYGPVLLGTLDERSRPMQLRRSPATPEMVAVTRDRDGDTSLPDSAPICPASATGQPVSANPQPSQCNPDSGERVRSTAAATTTSPESVT